MYCGKCKKSFDEDYKLCPYCGEPLTPEENIPAEITDELNQQSDSNIEKIVTGNTGNPDYSAEPDNVTADDNGNFDISDEPAPKGKKSHIIKKVIITAAALIAVAAVSFVSYTGYKHLKIHPTFDSIAEFDKGEYSTDSVKGKEYRFKVVSCKAVFSLFGISEYCLTIEDRDGIKAVGEWYASAYGTPDFEEGEYYDFKFDCISSFKSYNEKLKGTIWETYFEDSDAKYAVDFSDDYDVESFFSAIGDAFSAES